MSLPPITGSANITLGALTSAPPGPPHTYIGIARDFLAGAQILASASSTNSISLAFLCAQSSECGLKAFLSRNGNDTRITKNQKLRHDLGALWTLAASEGLPIANTPPSWLTILSHLHRSPYYLRYSTGVHGLTTPSAQPMLGELAELIESVLHQL